MWKWLAEASATGLEGRYQLLLLRAAIVRALLPSLFLVRRWGISRYEYLERGY